MSWRAQPVPRVPRSRRDDRYEAGRPAPYKRPSSGWVKSVQEDDGTCTVVILDERISGVIPLNDMPTPGDIVEVEARGDLMVILSSYDHPLPEGPFQWLSTSHTTADCPVLEAYDGADWTGDGYGIYSTFFEHWTTQGIRRVGDKMLIAYKTVTKGDSFQSRPELWFTGETIGDWYGTGTTLRARFVTSDEDGNVTYGPRADLVDFGLLYNEFYPYWYVMQIIPCGSSRAVVLVATGKDYVIDEGNNQQWTWVFDLCLLDCSGSKPTLIDRHSVELQRNRHSSGTYPYGGDVWIDSLNSNTLLMAVSRQQQVSGVGSTWQYELTPLRVGSNGFTVGTTYTMPNPSSDHDWLKAVVGSSDGKFMMTSETSWYYDAYWHGQVNTSTLTVTSVNGPYLAPGSSDADHLPYMSDDVGNMMVPTPTGLGLVVCNDYNHASEVKLVSGVPTMTGTYRNPAADPWADTSLTYVYGPRMAVAYEESGVAWAVTSYWKGNGIEMRIIRDLFGTPTQLNFNHLSVPGLAAFMQFVPNRTDGSACSVSMDFTPNGIGLVTLHSDNYEPEFFEVGPPPHGRYLLLAFQPGKFGG